MKTRFINRSLFVLIITISMALSGCANLQPTSDLERLIPVDNISYNPSKREQNTANSNLEQHLQNYYWTLESLTDNKATNKDNEKINLLSNFDHVEMTVTLNHFSFKICHAFIADFNPMQNDKPIFIISDYRISHAICDEEVQNIENYLASRILGVNEFDIELDEPYHAILTQITDEGAILKWKGEMTEYARYGEGEDVIWEVGPNTYPCSDNATKRCLKIREVEYKQGGKESGYNMVTVYSEWWLFPQAIQGFEHHQGTRTILMFKKYTVEPNKEEIYVLEHIIK